jgi:hypothetical protein
LSPRADEVRRRAARSGWPTPASTHTRALTARARRRIRRAAVAEGRRAPETPSLPAPPPARSHVRAALAKAADKPNPRSDRLLANHKLPVDSIVDAPYAGFMNLQFHQNSKQSWHAWQLRPGVQSTRLRSTCWPVRLTMMSGSGVKSKRAALPHAKVGCSSTTTSLARMDRRYRG